MSSQNITAMVLAARTTSVNGNDLDNTSSIGATVVIDITAITGTTPTATFTVEGRDEVSGKYYTILASAALNTVATTVLRIYPGLTAAANVTASSLIPKTFRVTVTIAGTTPVVTATVGVALHD
jgi:hypothetical protein